MSSGGGVLGDGGSSGGIGGDGGGGDDGTGGGDDGAGDGGGSLPVYGLVFIVVGATLFAAIIACLLREYVPLCSRLGRKRDGPVDTTAVSLDVKLPETSTMAERSANLDTPTDHLHGEYPKGSKKAAETSVATSDVRILPHGVSSSSCGSTSALPVKLAHAGTSSGLDVLGNALESGDQADGIEASATLEEERRAIKLRLRKYESKFKSRNEGRAPRLPDEWGEAWDDYKRYALLRRMSSKAMLSELSSPSASFTRSNSSLTRSSSSFARSNSGGFLTESVPGTPRLRSESTPGTPRLGGVAEDEAEESH